MVDDYLAKAVRCTTINQLNRLHIGLENVLAPAEMRALIDGVRARTTRAPEPVTHWLSRWDAFISGNGRPIQPYARRALAPGATVYSAPAGEDERLRRTLVIAYTGNAHRLMMPIGLFLQHCPAARYDFVVLFDTRRTVYLGGVEGLGASLPETIARLDELVRPSTYRRAVALGTSAGGLAAVWTGVALGLARAVSVGGVTPAQVQDRFQTQALEAAASFDEVVRTHRDALPEVVLVSGEKYERDNEKALEMGALVPAKLITVPGSTHHNMLADAFSAGGLDALLDRLLGDAPV